MHVGDTREIFCEAGAKSRRVRWKRRRQGGARSLGDRRIYGHWARRGVRTGVTGVTADDRIKHIKHGDVDNRHCPAGTPRTELLSENAILPRGDRSMVETAGINRDQIPAVERIEPLTWRDRRRDVWTAMKQLSKRRVKSVI